MKCEHEHDDGAYVLGALSPNERAAYEQHLATCSFCREAVSEIAVLPGLLGRLDPADFAKLLDPTLGQPPPPAPSPARTSSLVHAVQTTRRRERKRTRVRVLSTALAAAVLALIVGVGAVFVTGNSGPDTPSRPSIAMVPTDNSVPISAQVQLTATTGGTRVDLLCSYNRSSSEQKPYTVRLVAYGPDDEDDQLGSWLAVPGKEFSMPGTTHFPDGSLSRLELVRNDGKVLLAYDVP